MMGSKFSDRQREEARQMFAAGKTVAEVSRGLQIPECTLARWKARLEVDEDFQTLALKKKEQFIASTDRILNKAMTLLERKIDAALTGAGEIEPGKLSTIIGTIYDKKALAEGKNTHNVSVSYEEVLRKKISESEGEAEY